MKKITLLLIIVLGLSFCTQSFADGNTKKSKQNKVISSLQVIVEDFSVNLSFNLFKKSTYKVVLFSEDGEFMKVLDEGLHTADHYTYNIFKENLPQGKYICLIETEQGAFSEFFEIRETSNTNLIKLALDNENQLLYIHCNIQEPDYVLNIFHEDGIYFKTIHVQGQNSYNKLIINTSAWQSGDYFIHIDSGNTILSETIKI